jgi:hypothetical protein
LPEIAAGAALDSDALRRCVLGSLQRPEVGLRVILEDVLGQTSRIDAVALDGRGHLVAILIGSQGEDAALLTRGLAARAWLRDRIGDWAKLAPELKLREDTPVRALILTPHFAPETLGAAESLPRGWLDCVAYRSIRIGGQTEALLDLHGRPSALAGAQVPAAAPVAAVPEPPRFRSGLRDSDLGLDERERKHFEPNA